MVLDIFGAEVGVGRALRMDKHFMGPSTVVNSYQGGGSTDQADQRVSCSSEHRSLHWTAVGKTARSAAIGRCNSLHFQLSPPSPSQRDLRGALSESERAACISPVCRCGGGGTKVSRGQDTADGMAVLRNMGEHKWDPSETARQSGS